MNYKAIRDVIEAVPVLCTGELHDVTASPELGKADHFHCVVGELLFAAGVPNGELDSLDRYSKGIYSSQQPSLAALILAKYGSQLEKRYGITSEFELKELITVNDHTGGWTDDDDEEELAKEGLTTKERVMNWLDGHINRSTDEGDIQ